ncbi:MAG: 4-phosphopantetheinyl transferase family protein [Pedobacter sp.]|nr:MAG: 4-phosphopantetheinyl transferase family protein [Pedobacter sp.]
MIGNDIVDLAQAKLDSNWNRQGYLEKLFTEEEQFLISSNIQPDIMVWLLWSMKESAYKIGSRISKLREFAPVKLVCNNLIVHENTATGNVTYSGQLYFTSTLITDSYIHTIAVIAQDEIEKIRIEISSNDGEDHRSKFPDSVSHHGAYLALAYL